ncbi:AI-2E family transporter [bacterium]|nr:MAG: AI-2E family transporter [bacterium]
MEQNCCNEEEKEPQRELHLYIHLILAASLYLAFLILRSLLHPIIFAAVLASLCSPLMAFFERRFNGRRNIAAFFVVFSAALAILGPLILLLGVLVAEGVSSLARVQEWLQSGGLEVWLHHPRLAGLIELAKERLPFTADLDVNEQLLALSRKGGEALLSRGADMAANIVSATVQFFILLFVMFYFVRDGKEIIRSIKSLTPLEETQDDRIILRIRDMSRSVFVGSFLTAVVQGIVGGIGLSLVGIPGLFWGAIMGVVSLIPFVGTALVWIPAVLYLFIAGSTGSAIFLLAWSVLLVGSIDNFIRPYLIRGGGGLSPFYVFLAVIGGLEYFGLPGILYGPLILSFTAAILHLYKEEFPTVPHTIP